jgi:hypothetical protein
MGFFGPPITLPGSMPGGGDTSHWSGPPQHSGYWRGGTDWPERGGMGPQAGPHIPGLDPWDQLGHRPPWRQPPRRNRSEPARRRRRRTRGYQQAGVFGDRGRR